MAINKKKILIALGGNALGNNPKEQLESVLVPAKKIAELAKKGHTLIVGHGNGPQVGMIYNSFAAAHGINEKNPSLPLPEAGAMSQGYIGYHLSVALNNAYKTAKVNKDVLYVLTNSVVDANDPAFTKPTKPIGPFYKTKDEAKAANPKSVIVEDAGRGYRKVVASPIPKTFVGIKTIKKMIETGSTVILGGGGGIPVVTDNKGNVHGVDGVIDKDFALSKIATLVDADVFIVLTAVKKVFINYNKPNQKALTDVSVAELNKYLKEEQFASGSMKPKIQAAINFVKGKKDKVAYIGELNDLSKIISGETGTRVHS